MLSNLKIGEGFDMTPLKVGELLLPNADHNFLGATTKWIVTLIHRDGSYWAKPTVSNKNYSSQQHYRIGMRPFELFNRVRPKLKHPLP